jgi:SAM-dependent methyltransferase
LYFWVVDDLYEPTYGRGLLNSLTGTPQYISWVTRILRPHLGDRVLEIGAGTGATSAALLDALPPGRIDYTFTDVSPTLVARASERWGGPNRTFLTLDIERDPATQGLAEERFDIVVAANVLHATRDLRQTLAHVRRLVAPGGIVILLEGTARYRWVDLTFGLTDGWWRFTDFELRPQHPLLGVPEWLDLLAASGLGDPHRVPALASSRALASQTVLVARAEVEATAPAVARGDWVMLADRVGIGAAVAARLGAQGGQVTLVEPGGDAGAAIERASSSSVTVRLSLFAASSRSFRSMIPSRTCRGRSRARASSGVKLPL